MNHTDLNPRPVPRAVLRHKQHGASLVVTLLMLIAVLLLSASAAHIALQSEKASRNDRDRQVALQAAEAALMDAELDIEGSPDPESRSDLFHSDSTMGFEGPGCGASDDKYLGLCVRAKEGDPPLWQTVDLLDTKDAKTVPYGRFTGQSFQTGSGSLPARPPRYLIEQVVYKKAGEGAEKGEATYFYLITAIGFGTRDTTHVVLQTFYRKDGKQPT
jgi:type IV pilus assembly protein PilX